MLSKNDLLTLRNLLFSDRVTWRGNELDELLSLVARINGQINSMEPKKDGDRDQK